MVLVSWLEIFFSNACREVDQNARGAMIDTQCGRKRGCMGVMIALQSAATPMKSIYLMRPTASPLRGAAWKRGEEMRLGVLQ